MNFKKWVNSIQTAGYNGARTVHENIIKSFQQRNDGRELYWKYPNPRYERNIKTPKSNQDADKKLYSVEFQDSTKALDIK